MPNDKRIKRDKNGLYYVRYEAGFKADGTRNQKFRGGFSTADDAEDFLNEQKYNLRHGTYINPEKTLVCQYLNKWLEDRKEELSPTTYSGYEVNIRCHINPHIGGLRLQDLKAIHIKDMYKALQKDRDVTIDKEVRHFKKLSPKSILYVRRVLSKALEDACIDEILEKNAARTAKSPEVAKHKAKFLSTAQIKTMLEKFENDDLFVPVYLAVVLGLRRGEALGLRWENIDFDQKIIMIRSELTMYDGNPIFIEDVKTEDSDRDIIVTDRIIELLKRQKISQKENKLAMGKKYISKFTCQYCVEKGSKITEKEMKATDFICTWPDGVIFNPSHVTRSFKDRMKKFGLPEITFHELRHSNGALMISQNVQLKGASERLGHSTIVITNDYYGHVEKSVQESIANTIDRAIWNDE
jgi:integrase